MEIKEIYNSETVDYYKLCSQLFHSRKERDFFEKLADCDKNMSPDFTRLGVYEGDALLGGIQIVPYVVNFDGHDVKMGGIGGVVSSHEARGKGVMKVCFKKAFEVMREKGQYISHLYPFRGDYYRLYDYEITCDTLTWNIPSEYLRPCKAGEIRGYNGSDEMKADIMALYEDFRKGKNLCVKKDWDKFFGSIEPSFTDRYAYVHYTDGKADGVLAYTFNNRPDDRPFIDVPVFWYRNKAGIEGLLGLLASLKDYTDYVTIPCPDDLGMFVEFNGGWGKRDTKRNVKFCGSTRVIDVKKILELADFDGKATVKINDSYCPWNNGIFTVENGVVTEGGEPDCECGIKEFSALIMGRFEKTEFVPGLDIYKNEENIRKLFRKKEMWLDEHF